MKNQNGITLTALVSTIIVMALILGSISYNSFSSYQMNLFYNMRSDIELLDEKIALYYLENKDTEDHGMPIIEDDTITIDEIYEENNVNYNQNNDNTHKQLYKIDLSKLKNLSLNYTNYYIDKISHTIYMGDGIQVGEETYYTVPYNYTEIN